MKELWKVRRQVETKNKGSKTKFQRKGNSKQIIKQDNFISINMVHNDNNSHEPFNSICSLKIFHVFEKMLKVYRYLIETTTVEYYKTFD